MRPVNVLCRLQLAHCESCLAPGGGWQARKMLLSDKWVPKAPCGWRHTAASLLVLGLCEWVREWVHVHRPSTIATCMSDAGLTSGPPDHHTGVKVVRSMCLLKALCARLAEPRVANCKWQNPVGLAGFPCRLWVLNERASRPTPKWNIALIMRLAMSPLSFVSPIGEM